jgi:cysteine sulfinate desulfinase/cysteine desulfurase-like protein
VARAAVELARGQVAQLLHAQPREIVFTASGTEADAPAIRGSLRITLGRFNTVEEADHFTAVLPAAVRSLRTITSLVSSA